MKTIEINHITKDYGGRRGVFDLSFQVNQGEVLGFLGPNGAGKTTTIRQLMGYIKPDSGSVSILGKDCFAHAAEIQSSLGYLPGEIAFMDSMNGMEFIRFVAKMKRMKDLGRAPELMEQFELDASGKLKKMSKGMKQKIGIVCAFMQDPDILILDEPTSGLDPLMQNRFVDLILSEKKRGKTILMSSHIFEEIEKTCDRAAIIRAGELVAVDSMEKLCSGKRKELQITFAEEQMAAAYVQAFDKAECAAANKRTVVMKVGKELDAAIKQAGNYTVTDMDIHTQSLEDFFLHFYGGDE
ncbi:MAG: ABC transporter ATP-binding protein [Hespellia sp.]|nr:ABC transporter ATP-binding protein [Hespellia sp.]